MKSDDVRTETNRKTLENMYTHSVKNNNWNKIQRVKSVEALLKLKFNWFIFQRHKQHESNCGSGYGSDTGNDYNHKFLCVFFLIFTL